MNVYFSDRNENIEYLRMALSICEICVDYQTAELIDNVVNETRKKKGKFDLKDGVLLLSAWKTTWKEYDKKMKEEETK